ncbi:ABC transporter ATP-binding protein [Ginsengibacter hankyongi]|uniref:ABC transporter ATP-binding protein n=1 Tax=Ginsengibacter hankyongi TaxID=2607284 RepID=A0A5J5IDL8_9BACT|nr:ABC transporter ATP-binding protein [Ginsengibacter hankyongi]KAA9036380.1 ABC transporter ATP-binding protein [Ginsengibacter hankyongi]
MGNTVIKVENLSKQYRLGEVGTGAMKDDIKRWRYKMMGKEDPFLKIGEENDRTVKSNSKYVWALRDINFEVRQGEVLGIIGRNGAGKSTLLKILSRTTGPTIGSVKMKGRIASLLEVGTGFHGELSGRENIFLNGAIMGMTKAEIKSKLDEIIDFAGVEKYIDTPVKRYSSGMYVRLAFGVAAHLDPDIMIVDEVLAVGDADFQKKALGKMKDVSTKDGRTVLFVSHNMASIQTLCSKAVVLKNGRIDSPVGDVQNAIKEYLFSAQKNSIIELNARNDRQGRGNIKFVNIEFLNEDDQPQIDLITGQYVKIKLDYESGKNAILSNITVAAAIYGDDGLLYTMVGNEFSSGSFAKINSNGSFICELKKLPIVAGNYLLNIIVSQDGVMEDWVQEAISFNVENGDFYGTGKIIPISHRSLLIENRWNII